MTAEKIDEPAPHDAALDQCKDFLTAIFEPEDIIEFRPIKPTSKKWATVANIPKIVEWLRGLNDRGAQCYFGANPRRASGGSREEDVALARCLCADFDAGVTVEEALRRIKAAGLPMPTVVIVTGNGVHCWWRLDKPITDRADWSRRQKAIAVALRSDESIHDWPRIMRLPGFVNHKYDHKPVAELVDVDTGRVYPVEKLVPVKRKMSNCTVAFIDRGEYPPGASRRETMFKAACDLRDNQWKPDDAVAVLMERMKQFGLSADDLDDCPRQIRNAWKKEPRTIVATGDVQAAPAEAEAAAEEREAVRIEWQPVGEAGRTRVIARGIDTGAIIDIDTIDISQAKERRAYAVRAAAEFGRSRVADVEAELLQVAVERCSAVPPAPPPPLTFADCVTAWEAHEKKPVIATGLRAFDDKTDGGLPIGGIVAFVAPPGVGKTAIGLQLAVGALLEDPELLAVWGMGEMTLQAMAARGACVGAALIGDDPVTMADAGARSAGARKTLRNMAERLGDRLAVVPAPLTLERIDERIAATGAKLVVIDYLQLMEGHGDDRVQELDRLIGGIRQMAIERECAVIVISSMAKAAGHTSRIGQFAKGSGEIDYAVELLYVGRFDDEDANGRPIAGDDGTVGITWHCKKARNLPQVDIALRFDGACQTYTAPLLANLVDAFMAFAPETGR
jgi:replicative DNA helicase